MPSITRDEAREKFDYNPETGEFTWKVPSGRMKPGDVAGGVQVRGCIAIGTHGRQIKAHRLAFIWMTGDCPKEVDHINGDPTDNRWSNLREATPQQNKFNRGTCKSNKSGFKGVSRHKQNGNWVAEITHNYRKYHIGCFDTPEEAHEAYKKAAYILHGEFARAA